MCIWRKISQSVIKAGAREISRVIYHIRGNYCFQPHRRKSVPPGHLHFDFRHFLLISFRLKQDLNYIILLLQKTLDIALSKKH
jgi:hypothetical protein